MIMGSMMDKLKGKAKKAQGALTGSRTKQLEGELEELKGKVKEKLEELEHEIKKPPEY
jgi:uncharacterized protein YjbJ (UPF0337 family)